MRELVQIYVHLIGARIRGQMQYRTSFLFELLGFGLLTGLDFAAIALLLNRFDGIAGWQLAEVALLYGIVSFCFGIAELVGRGFDIPFATLIQRGGLDGILTRPLPPFLQVLGSEFQLRRLGRIGQGALVMAVAIGQLSIRWDVAKLLVFGLTLVAGTLIFLAIIVIFATICIWTVRMPEVVYIFTNGGVQMNSFPLDIYSQSVRLIFLGLIPTGFAGYPATLYLLERSSSFGLPAASAWFALPIALLFFAAAYGFWRIGLRHYSSTGS